MDCEDKLDHARSVDHQFEPKSASPEDAADNKKAKEKSIVNEDNQHNEGDREEQVSNVL